MGDIERVARLTIVAVAVWAAIYTVGAADAPDLLVAGQVLLGASGAVVCAVVAIHPSLRRVQVALTGAAIYAAWNAVRLVVVDPADARTVVRGVATFAALAQAWLAVAAMYAVLARIDAIARDLDDDQ